MEAAWAVVAAVSARAEKCVSPFSHYKPTADLTPFFINCCSVFRPRRTAESIDKPLERLENFENGRRFGRAR